MSFVNTIKIQKFTLIITLGICNAFSFNTPETNVNEPAALLSIFQLNNRHYPSWHKDLQHSPDLTSLNVQIQGIQGIHGSSEKIHQNIPLVTDFNGYYYPPLPPHSMEFNDSEYYTAPPYLIHFLQPPTYSAQFSQMQKSYAQSYLEPDFLTPKPDLTPINQNPAVTVHETPTTTSLPENIKHPPTSLHSVWLKQKPKAVITPDSPLYVQIPEEPALGGIQPRY